MFKNFAIICLLISLAGCAHPRYQMWELHSGVLLGAPGEADKLVQFGDDQKYTVIRNEDMLEQIKYNKKCEIDLWPF